MPSLWFTLNHAYLELVFSSSASDTLMASVLRAHISIAAALGNDHENSRNACAVTVFYDLGAPYSDLGSRRLGDAASGFAVDDRATG